MGQIIESSVVSGAGGISLENRNDDELMLLTRAGVNAAFDALVRRHQALSLRIATQVLGERAAARDAAQEAFVAVYRNRDRYRVEGKFSAYFHRVLLNQCRMARRSAAGRARRLKGLDVSPQPQLSDDMIIAREKHMEVQRALAQVNEKAREVLVLRFAGECSYQQIAEVLQIPIGTVKSRIFGGLDKLRQIMSGGMG